jgi:hypothetical protein
MPRAKIINATVGDIMTIEAQLAMIDAERAYERSLTTMMVKQMEERRQQFVDILTAHLSPAHAAANIAWFNAKDDHLKLGREQSDVYRAHLARMMTLNAKMEEDYRAAMSEESKVAANEASAMAIATALKEYEAVDAAMEAAMAAKDAEIARLTEELAAFQTMAT